MAVRIRDTGAKWLLPGYMRRDEFDVAFCDIVDEFGNDMLDMSRLYSVWNVIDELTEENLDALADEMSIQYYDKTFAIHRKRNIVKNARKIQAKLGTKWALQKVIEIYFSQVSRVVEWFDYEEGPGIPNHFRIETMYSSHTTQEQKRFMNILSMVKRKSAVLDSIMAIYERQDSYISVAPWLSDLKTTRQKSLRFWRMDASYASIKSDICPIVWLSDCKASDSFEAIRYAIVNLIDVSDNVGKLPTVYNGTEIESGSTCVMADTLELYVFDQSRNTWHKQFDNDVEYRRVDITSTSDQADNLPTRSGIIVYESGSTCFMVDTEELYIYEQSTSKWFKS